MSTANPVPETWDLQGVDVGDVVEGISFRDLVRQGILRFSAADGFSFARALAFQVVLTVIPGLILVVAVGTRLGTGSYQDILRSMLQTVAPGPAGDIFRAALDQGASSGAANLAVIISAALAMVGSGAAALAQLQSGTSRIYGVERDRPRLKRYGLATGMMLISGTLLIAGFILLSVGDAVTSVLGSYGWIWQVGRWPAAALAVMIGLTALFKVAPNRRQPSLRWLVTGTAIAMVLWVVVTAGLALFLSVSTTFGETYGPLAGFIGLMLWAQLGSMAIMIGLAYAAQLEAHRAGFPKPESPMKAVLAGSEDETIRPL